MWIDLSTTNKGADAMSTTLRTTWVRTYTVFSSVRLHLSSNFVARRGGPKAFDIIITFSCFCTIPAGQFAAGRENNGGESRRN